MMRGLLVSLALALLVGACGFQLRGAAGLPFDTVYIEGAGHEVGAELERAIRPTQTRVARAPEEAQAVLQILSQARDKQILTLSGAGRVSEFRLIYRLAFRVRDSKGTELLVPQQIELKRDMTYNDAQVLAKEAEEALLYREMQNDAVQQVIRRVSALKKPS